MIKRLPLRAAAALWFWFVIVILWLTTKPKRVRDNLPKPPRQALRKLKHRKDIVIKSADKVSDKT